MNGSYSSLIPSSAWLVTNDLCSWVLGCVTTTCCVGCMANYLSMWFCLGGVAGICGLILVEKTWPIICVNPVIALTIPIWIWYKFSSWHMKYYNCFSRICMFIKWMWWMDPFKALKPFLVASTKFSQAIEFFFRPRYC